MRDLVEVVLARVQEHMGTNEQHDDITIVAVRPGIVSEHNSLPRGGRSRMQLYDTLRGHKAELALPQIAP